MKFYAAVVAAALFLVGGTSIVLSADEPAAPHAVHHHHPRRRQIHRRLKRQRARINAKERAGKLSHARAGALRKHDHEIHAEEKDMKAQDGGHLTKQDQGTLNRQLNQNSNEIKNQ
jgi:hypothetical protein